MQFIPTTYLGRSGKVEGGWSSLQYPGEESLPGMLLDAGAFRVLKKNDINVYYEEIPVAFLYCTSESWDRTDAHRNNKGIGTIEKPFRNLLNAIAQAQFIRKFFPGMGVRIIIDGTLDYSIEQPVVYPDYYEYPNPFYGDECVNYGLINGYNIFFDFTNCTVKDNITLDISNGYYIGLNAYNIKIRDVPYDIYSSRDEILEPFGQYECIVFDNCQITGKDFEFRLNNDLIMKSCVVNTDSFSPDYRQGGRSLIIDCDIHLTGYYDVMGDYVNPYLKSEWVVNSRITSDPKAKYIYVLDKSRIVNCSVDRPLLEY